MNPVTKNRPLTIDDFPADIRRLLKVRAAMNEQTIRQSVIDAVGMWLRSQDDHVPVPRPRKSPSRQRRS